MSKRKIIKIDEEKCNGCGQCIPNCPEGALQIIDGKARLISDIFCDGLGACIGHCPEGAITTEDREAEPYNEKKAMKNIVKAGENTIIAHLKHLKDHGEKEYLKQALEYLKENEIEVDFEVDSKPKTLACGCPGSMEKDFTNDPCCKGADEKGNRVSQLRQWPVQLHLISPYATYFEEADVVLCADCVAYSLADFHKDYLKDKRLAIACPKLDSNIDSYIDKVTDLIDAAKIKSLTVITMEVPCCNGLLYIAQQSIEKAERKIPIKHILVSVKGEILKNGEI